MIVTYVEAFEVGRGGFTWEEGNVVMFDLFSVSVWGVRSRSRYGRRR